MFGKKSVLFGTLRGSTMDFRKVVSLCLVLALIVSGCPAVAEGVEELPGIQMIIEGLLIIHVCPFRYCYARKDGRLIDIFRFYIHTLKLRIYCVVYSCEYQIEYINH